MIKTVAYFYRQEDNEKPLKKFSEKLLQKRNTFVSRGFVIQIESGKIEELLLLI